MLDAYDLPWYYDTFDSRYLFVKTHTDNYLQEGPFQHTKRLRLENTYLTEHSQQTLEHNLEESEPEREKNPSRFKAFVSGHHDLNSERPHSTSALSRHTGLHTNMLCNFCLQPISGSAYHRWSICADDDYALCLACIDRGIGCSENSHGMTRRTIKEGDIHG